MAIISGPVKGKPKKGAKPTSDRPEGSKPIYGFIKIGPEFSGHEKIKIISRLIGENKKCANLLLAGEIEGLLKDFVTDAVLDAVAAMAVQKVWVKAQLDKNKGIFDGPDMVWLGARMSDVDTAAGIQGFSGMMVAAGWLEKADDGLVFPQYVAHCMLSGSAVAIRQRKLRAERAAKKAETVTCNATGNASDDGFSVTCNASGANPSVTGNAEKRYMSQQDRYLLEVVPVNEFKQIKNTNTEAAVAVFGGGEEKVKKGTGAEQPKTATGNGPQSLSPHHQKSEDKKVVVSAGAVEVDAALRESIVQSFCGLHNHYLPSRQQQYPHAPVAQKLAMRLYRAVIEFWLSITPPNEERDFSLLDHDDQFAHFFCGIRASGTGQISNDWYGRQQLPQLLSPETFGKLINEFGMNGLAFDHPGAAPDAVYSTANA